MLQRNKFRECGNATVNEIIEILKSMDDKPGMKVSFMGESTGYICYDEDTGKVSCDTEVQDDMTCFMCEEASVLHVISILENFMGNDTNVFHFFGDVYGYIHYDEDDNIIIFDDNSLEDEYED